MRAGKYVIDFLYLLMGALFLPVFFCVVFIGNHMDYNEGLKVNALLPNYVFLAIALAGVAVICLLSWRVRKVCLTLKADLAIDGFWRFCSFCCFLPMSVWPGISPLYAPGISWWSIQARNL